VPDDLLTRYRDLTPSQRLIEVKTMMVEVFERLEEHSGMTVDELVLLATGLTSHCERRRSARRESRREKPELTRYQKP